MTQLFRTKSNSEVMAVVSNKSCRCPPSVTERFLRIRILNRFGFPSCHVSDCLMVVLIDAVLSEAQTFLSSLFICVPERSVRWQRGARSEGQRWGTENEGAQVLVKHYVTALTRKWNAQHQSGGEPRSKAAPHSPIWFCLTSALLFSSLVFSRSLWAFFFSFSESGPFVLPRQKFLHVTEATTW